MSRARICVHPDQATQLPTPCVVPSPRLRPRYGVARAPTARRLICNVCHNQYRYGYQSDSGRDHHRRAMAKLRPSPEKLRCIREVQLVSRSVQNDLFTSLMLVIMRLGMFGCLRRESGTPPQFAYMARKDWRSKAKDGDAFTTSYHNETHPTEAQIRTPPHLCPAM